MSENMTIAQKLELINENMEKVYQAGVSAGILQGAENRRVYSAEITVDGYYGTGSYITLRQDPFLITIRNEPALFVRVESDTTQSGSIVKTWGSNGGMVIPVNSSQLVHRLNSAGAANMASFSEPINGTEFTSVGVISITDGGELRWYNNSTGTYRFFRSKVKIIIEW